MEGALQRRIQQYGWDKATDYYEGYWQKQLKPAQELLLTLADIRPGDNIIDVACGTGLVSFKAAMQTGETGFVSANDISGKMVERATQIALEKNIRNIKFERMDAEELRSEDELYSVSLCALGLMYVPDPVKALKEMYRVLKTGGRAVAAVWGRRMNCGWAEIFEIVDRRVTSEVCPMFFNLGNADVLKRSFEMAGFHDVKTERIKSVLEYTSGEEACGAAFAGGPVALAYNKFPDQVKLEAHAEYLESIAPFKQNTGYQVPGEFVVAIGYKE
jgi:ubiquinone/menaquinone biosynthesis C-methylase UbiE